MELTNLKKEVSTVENERKIAKLEDELFCEYLEFQRTLRQIRVDDSAATLVALIIMKADAYWFAARVCREDFDRERQYTKAKEYFMELLRRSETSLKPHDVSRIRILEKLSELFVEYPDRADIRLRDQCIDAYRKALKARSDRGDDEVLDSLLETIAANLQKSELNY
ncbi:hypothetical protein AB6A40_007212 [Gnathostoma spinigerum]|uniref:Uncharacterized protein n=1 Tax=Gnathostoma spinigerum TaxID=75299 RepID=A0ABD6ETY3_9BILA